MRRILLLLAASLLLALAPAAAQAGSSSNPNPVLFPKKSQPYGADIATWGERATQWIYRQPLDRSPLFDDTGANCAVDQHGPVWFIARVAGPPVFSGTRSCTIPAHKAVFLYIGADVEDYPCPAFPGFEPPPGQSLYDFLSGIAEDVMDTVDLLEVSLDGQPIDDVLSYRYASTTSSSSPAIRACSRSWIRASRARGNRRSSTASSSCSSRSSRASTRSWSMAPTPSATTRRSPTT